MHTCMHYMHTCISTHRLHVHRVAYIDTYIHSYMSVCDVCGKNLYLNEASEYTLWTLSQQCQASRNTFCYIYIYI